MLQIKNNEGEFFGQENEFLPLICVWECCSARFLFFLNLNSFDWIVCFVVKMTTNTIPYNNDLIGTHRWFFTPYHHLEVAIMQSSHCLSTENSWRLSNTSAKDFCRKLLFGSSFGLWEHSYSHSHRRPQHPATTILPRHHPPYSSQSPTTILWPQTKPSLSSGRHRGVDTARNSRRHGIGWW